MSAPLTHYHSHKKLYIIIFVLLAVLTGVEILIPDMKISYIAKATGLTVLALGKAFFVAWYYMHLNEETPWLRFIALLPVMAFMYAVVLMVEGTIR